MANTFNSYADVFNQVLDENYYIDSVTSLMERNRLGIIYEGGKTVKIPKMSVQGMGNVVNSVLPNRATSFSYESKEFDWDRGGSMALDRFDPNDTNFAATTGAQVRVLMSQELVPEMDKVRIAKVASAAITAGKVAYGGNPGDAVLANPLADLIANIGVVKDKIGEEKEIYVLMSQTIKTSLLMDSNITKFLSIRDVENRNVNTKAEYINDARIIGVPSRYMWSKFNVLDGTTSGQESGGVVKADDAVGINWAIIAADSVFAAAFPRVTSMFAPGEVHGLDAYCVDYRFRHGCWIYDNKIDGILVNLKANAPNG